MDLTNYTPTQPEYNEKSACNDKDMITGNINRMFITDDMAELDSSLLFAVQRLKAIHEYHKKRIEAENSNEFSQ